MKEFRVELEMIVNLVHITRAETKEEAIKKAKERYDCEEILIEDTEDLNVTKVEEIQKNYWQIINSMR